ncbi:MAG: hypothetical protein ACI9UN_003235 [Granulosicoccus sp.]|jgi:hypothetical protein
MLQKITGFHQDDKADWVAELSCGHGQHVRHNPLEISPLGGHAGGSGRKSGRILELC